MIIDISIIFGVVLLLLGVGTNSDLAYYSGALSCAIGIALIVYENI